MSPGSSTQSCVGVKSRSSFSGAPSTQAGSAPLKLLRDFVPTLDWVLEPGGR